MTKQVTINLHDLMTLDTYRAYVNDTQRQQYQRNLGIKGAKVLERNTQAAITRALTADYDAIKWLGRGKNRHITAIKRDAKLAQFELSGNLIQGKDLWPKEIKLMIKRSIINYLMQLKRHQRESGDSNIVSMTKNHWLTSAKILPFLYLEIKRIDSKQLSNRLYRIHSQLDVSDVLDDYKQLLNQHVKRKLWAEFASIKEIEMQNIIMIHRNVINDDSEMTEETENVRLTDDQFKLVEEKKAELLKQDDLIVKRKHNRTLNKHGLNTLNKFVSKEFDCLYHWHEIEIDLEKVDEYQTFNLDTDTTDQIIAAFTKWRSRELIKLEYKAGYAPQSLQYLRAYQHYYDIAKELDESLGLHHTVAVTEFREVHMRALTLITECINAKVGVEVVTVEDVRQSLMMGYLTQF